MGSRSRNRIAAVMAVTQQTPLPILWRSVRPGKSLGTTAKICRTTCAQRSPGGVPLPQQRRKPGLLVRTAPGGRPYEDNSMADLVLYHAVPSRAATVRWMLEETGEHYDVHPLKLAEGEQQKPEYLAINPQGKVPALRHNGVVITESAAICTYLADAFPRARLNIPVGDPRRGVYLQWLFFQPSCVEPAICDR